MMQDDVTQDDVTQDDVTQDDVTQDDVTQDDVIQNVFTKDMVIGCTLIPSCGVHPYAIRLHNRRQKLWCASLGIGLVLSMLLTQFCGNMGQFASTCTQVRTDTLRLHVQANSNSVQDQSVKLQVRDAVLAQTLRMYQGAQDCPQATQRAAACLQQFACVAQQVLAKSRVQQAVHVYLTQMYFDTTEYEGFTLPAGVYTALRVELGAHQGKNWWCVLYPELCIATAGASYQKADEQHLVVGDYQIEFALIEWLEKRKQAKVS